MTKEKQSDVVWTHPGPAFTKDKTMPEMTGASGNKVFMSDGSSMNWQEYVAFEDRRYQLEYEDEMIRRNEGYH